MLSLKNPFLSLILGNTDIKFDSLKDDELTVKIDKKLGPTSMTLFKDLISRNAANVLSKFKEWKPKTIMILGKDNQLTKIDINYNVDTKPIKNYLKPNL